MKKIFNNTTIFYALNIIIPIILGFAFYIYFTPYALISRLFFMIFGIEHGIVFRFHGYVGQFLANYAADMLWAYALAFSVSALFRNHIEGFNLSAVVCISFEVMIELLQYANVFYGSFDWLDITFEALMSLVALFIIEKYKKAHPKPDAFTLSI